MSVAAPLHRTGSPHTGSPHTAPPHTAPPRTTPPRVPGPQVLGTRVLGRRVLGRRRRARTARRWLWRLRWLVVAVCCGLAASATVQALRPAPPALRSVVVPVHRLTAGTQVQPDDVAVVPVPATLAPDTALTDPADAVGRVPAVTLEAGLPLSAGLVSGGEVAASAPDGTVVVPVRLDDATAALLRPGDHVDLVSTAYLDDAASLDDPAAAATDGTTGEPAAAYLARRALVLPTGSRDGGPAGSGGLLGGATGSGAATITLVAVTRAEAPPLSAASGTGTVAAVLVP